MNSLELLITSSDSCSVTDYRVLQERLWCGYPHYEQLRRHRSGD
ncbi:hypothetical protein [Paenibacillus sp. FSL L8-0644]